MPLPEQSPFPGQRNPRSLDSSLASAPLDPQFLRAFKQALPSSGRPSFFVPEVAQEDDDGRRRRNVYPNDFRPHQQVAWNAPTSVVEPLEQHQDLYLQYPVCLFFDFPSLPKQDVLDSLVEDCSNRFIQHAPFIHKLSLARSGSRLPHHLSFAMAAIGSLLSHDPAVRAQSSKLWQAAIFVHSANAEVDNRMARRIDWIFSFNLMQTFGVLHSDGPMRAWTNAWNGHVDTAIRRTGLNRLYGHSPQDVTGGEGTINARFTDLLEHAKIMSFYFLMDTLRALHFSVPASFYPSAIVLPLSDGTSVTHALGNLSNNPESSMDHLNREDKLLLLVTILSEIVAAQTFLGPLYVSQVNDRSQERDISTDPTHSAPNLTVDRHRTERNFNPFLASSSTEEYIRARSTLQSALDIWGDKCLNKLEGRPTSEAEHESALGSSQDSLSTLFFFCRLLLAAGPSLQSFQKLAGYCAETDFSAPKEIPSTSIPEFSAEAVKMAWQILESIESQTSPTNGLTPVWNPIATFQAGLVAWAGLHSVTSRRISGEIVQMKRMLRLLEVELREMMWPCATAMADILQALRTRKPDTSV